MKDFLFFNYDWVANSSYIFKSFEHCGYSCDFVNEEEINTFIPNSKYRVVVAYLHDPSHNQRINFLMKNYLQDSFFIQHDDTDFEDVQVYYERQPDLVMHRELTKDSKIPFSCPVIPHHFPIPSFYMPQYQEKTIDVVFYGTPTHPARSAFIEKIVDLASNDLKHLNWDIAYIKHEAVDDPMTYPKAINSSKIGLNFPGNSFDSWRNWELASTRVAILQPKLKCLSTSKEYMPFDSYVTFEKDFSDIKDKIIWLLENNRWEKFANAAFDDYNKNHTPEKVFEFYHDQVMKYAPIDPLPIISLKADRFYWENRNNAYSANPIVNKKLY